MDTSEWKRCSNAPCVPLARALNGLLKLAKLVKNGPLEPINSFIVHHIDNLIILYIVQYKD